MAAATAASITLHSGEKIEFTESVGDEKNQCHLKTLQSAISKLQKQTNDALTDLVNKEKAAKSQETGKVSDNPKDASEDEDDEDDEGEDEENADNEEEADGEPVKKKAKS